MNPEEFKRQLAIHDWYYQYSDDPAAFARGQQNEGRLRALAASDPELQKLYNGYKNGGNSPCN